MQARNVVALTALVSTAVACASSHAPVAPSRSGRDNAALASAVAERACPDSATGATRWLDSAPHTPLLITDGTGVHPAGQSCCTAWARTGSRWRAIGAYGEVTGSSVVIGAESYDATQCSEPSFRLVNGAAGSGLYASEAGAWRAPAKSARWEAPPPARQALAKFVSDAERLLLDGPIPWGDAKPLPPLDMRVLYFEAPAAPYGGERSVHHAVIGGDFLLIAYENQQGRWVLSHYQARFARAGGKPPYLPVAVFDLDGDEVPEIVYHEDAGESWSDVVLKLDENSLGWREVATSIGSASI